MKTGQEFWFESPSVYIEDFSENVQRNSKFRRNPKDESSVDTFTIGNCPKKPKLPELFGRSSKLTAREPEMQARDPNESFGGPNESFGGPKE